MNQQQILGKWKDIKGEIRNQWGKLTDDELESAKGNIESIAGLIQKRYGDAKESVEEKLKALLCIFENESKEFSENMKDKVADTTAGVKENLRQSDKH